MENLAAVITRIPFFSGLSREDLARIAGKLEEERFSAGEIIVSQGEVGDSMYVVHSGAVEVVVENNGVRVESLGVLGPYETFGEMSLFTGEKRSATVLALVNSVVLKLRKDAWEELLAKYPPLSLHFCKVLSRRLVERHREAVKGRASLNQPMEEFLSQQSAEVQDFLLRSSLLRTLDPAAIQSVFAIPDPTKLLASLSLSQPVFVRTDKDGNYEYLEYLRDFLSVRLAERVERKERSELHLLFATYFSNHAKWAPAVYHYIRAEAWKEAAENLQAHGDKLLNSEPPKEILEWFNALPADVVRAYGNLLRLRAEAHVRLGDTNAAIRNYQEFLFQKQASVTEALDTARYYQELAELHRKKGDVSQALGCLRLGLNVMEEGSVGTEPVQAIHSIGVLQQKRGSHEAALRWGERTLDVARKLRAETATRIQGRNRKWWGLVLALAAGIGIWHMPPPPALDERGVHFLASLVAAVILWGFEAFDQYVVAMILLLVWLLSGVVSPQIAVAGFSDSGWFFVLGILGISAAITKSGLLYRVALQVLRRIPQDYKIYSFIFAASGLLVTPLLPDLVGRVAIMAQISHAVSERMGFKLRSPGSAGLVLSAFVGYSQMTFMFLTGASFTLIGWNLLPEAARAEFGWMTWTLAALPAGIFTLLFLVAAVHLFFRVGPNEQVEIAAKTLETQLEILGPLTKGEWLSLAVLALAVVGWSAKPLHGIAEAWIALGAFSIFLLTGVLDKNGLKNNIDWGLLLFFGVISSLGVITAHLKVDRWLIEFFGSIIGTHGQKLEGQGLMDPVLSTFSFHPLPFLLVVALVVYLVSFFLRKSPAVILLTLSLSPWAQDMGIHPGVLLLTILIALESWFLPYQSQYYQMAYYSTEEKAFSHAQARRLMVAKFFASFLAIAISVPYWKMLGFIR